MLPLGLHIQIGKMDAVKWNYNTVVDCEATIREPNNHYGEGYAVRIVSGPRKGAYYAISVRDCIILAKTNRELVGFLRR
jgi:hypothetical protein